MSLTLSLPYDGQYDGVPADRKLQLSPSVQSPCHPKSRRCMMGGVGRQVDRAGMGVSGRQVHMHAWGEGGGEGGREGGRVWVRVYI